MPRLLDDSDLAELRRLGISVRPIRRARRRYFLELLRDVERESERIASVMARLPAPEFAEIMEFRRATRRHVMQLRLFAFFHGLGFHVERLSRKHSASVTAMLRAVTG